MNYLKIKDICTLQKGKTGITKAVPGNYPLVTTGRERKTHLEYQFNTKAVCIPLVSSTGHGHASIKRIFYQDGKFALGSILTALIPKDENQLEAKFLYLYLSQFKDKVLVPLMKGTANVSLSISKIGSVEIPLPDIKKQNELIKHCELIEENKSLLSEEYRIQESIVSKLRQSILQEAFRGKLVSQNRNDKPASELLNFIRAGKNQLVAGKKIKIEKSLHYISDDEIPFELPNGWIWCRLGEIVDLKMGQAPKSSECNFVGDGVPFVKVGQFGLLKPKINEWTTSPKRVVDEKHILLCVVGATVGKINLGIKCSIGRSVAGLLPNDLILKQLYLYNFLKTWTLALRKKSRGSAIGTINRKTINNVLIPIPPLPEQKNIIIRIEKLMTLCDQLESQITDSKKNADMLMKSILQEAFAS